NDEIRAALEQRVREIGGERALVRQGCEGRRVVAIAGRGARQQVDVEVGELRLQGARDEHGLQTCQVARAAEQPYAHKSSHPNGRSSSRNSNWRLRRAMSARAASTWREANAFAASIWAKRSWRVMTGAPTSSGPVVSSARRSITDRSPT